MSRLGSTEPNFDAFGLFYNCLKVSLFSFFAFENKEYLRLNFGTTQLVGVKSEPCDEITF